MLIRQLLWRERAQYSLPDSPPPSICLSRAPSRYILLLPSSATPHCPPTPLHHPSAIHVAPFQSLSISSLQVLPPSHLSSPPPRPSSLSSCDTISLLNFPHPTYLFAWLSRHRHSPLSRFLSHERLRIPLAWRLIYHPSRGYMRWRRVGVGGGGLASETEGRRLRHLFKFSLPTGLFT